MMRANASLLLSTERERTRAGLALPGGVLREVSKFDDPILI
jgi:hypothetical protein